MTPSAIHSGRAGRVSIALCTFNGERYLPEQLESIAQQTHMPYELVVCDDASTDATVEMVKAFAERVSFPVRFYRNPVNIGSTLSFERAMRHCNGDFIALCDQDDVWLPNKIAALARMLTADSELGGVFSDGELIDGRSRGVGKSLWNTFGFGPAQRRKFARRGAASVLITRPFVTGATLMVRARLCPMFFPIPTEWVHDGWIAWVLAIYSKLSFCPERLIRYRLHSNQQVGVGAKSLTERIERARSVSAEHYLALATQLEALRDRISGAPSDNSRGAVSALEGKIEHCRRRAAMPLDPLGRFASVVAHLADYWRYSRPLRSICKDLLASVLSSGLGRSPITKYSEKL